MPGLLKGKARAIITLTSTGASLTNNSAAAAGTELDTRDGAGNAEGDFEGRLELVCQWATITGIVKGTVVAECYLVPKLDGTNLPNVDLTAGSSALPLDSHLVAFTCVVPPVVNTNMRFISSPLLIRNELLTAYLQNRSGQTLTANWTLKAVTAQAQYT